MTLPASDSFTSATTQAITAYSTNWANALNAMYVEGGANGYAFPGGSGLLECCSYWNADAFNPNQFSEAVVGIAGVFDDAAIGVAVRCTTNNYYGVYYSTTGGGSGGILYLFKVIGGTWAELGSTTGLLATNDVMRLEANGTALAATVKRAGTTIFTLSATDSSISAGKAGITGWNFNGVARLLDWTGGNLGAGGADIVVAQVRRRRHFVIDSWR